MVRAEEALDSASVRHVGFSGVISSPEPVNGEEQFSEDEQGNRWKRRALGCEMIDGN